MTTTADLNIKVPTGDIDKAIKSLDALALKAKTTAFETAKIAKERTSAAAQMARAGHIEASAALRTVQATKSSTSAQIAAAKHTANGARAAYDAARAADAKATATMRAAKADLEAAAASRTAAAANDNQAMSARQMGMTAGVQTAHMTNMAAQFQDIGVTAAMGMNPMMIALQQGTQMSLVMSDAVGRGGLAGAVGILGRGLLQILSPLSLLIIGFVAAAAAIIQMIDWTAVLRTSLDFLAANMETIIRWTTLFGVVMAVAFAPQIVVAFIGLIKGVASALLGATKAMLLFALSNPFTAFVLAVGIALAAVIYFRDAVSEYIGRDVVQVIYDAGNKFVALTVTAVNTLLLIWQNFGVLFQDFWISVLNGVIVVINSFLRYVRDAILEIMFDLNNMFGEMGEGAIFVRNAWNDDGLIPMINTSGTATQIGQIGNEYYNAALGAEYFTKAVDGSLVALDDFSAYAADYLSGLSSDLGMTTDKDGKPKKVSGPKTKKEAVDKAKKFADMMTEADQTIKQLTREGLAVGKVGYEYKRAAAMNDMLNQAERDGIVLSKEHTALLQKKADAIARLQQENEQNAQYWTDLRGYQEEADTYRQEIAMLGLRGDAAAEAAMGYKFLNDEKYRGLKFDEQQQKNLTAAAVEAEQAKTVRDSAKAYKEQSEAMAIAQGEALLYRDAIYMGAGATAEAEMRLKLYNDEMYRGLKYSEEQKKNLIANAGYLARLNEQNKILADNMKFVQDTTKGVFRDMFDGLREGESIWKAFGNTVLNVLNKIIDRILDLSLEMAFKQDGPGGGFLNSVASFFNGLLGKGGAARAADSHSKVLARAQSVLGSANGNVFRNGQAAKFAAGGVFTNGIVSRPTTFDMGLMGEAGPEAIMPLKRGPDGSLGVQMNGNARTSPESVEVNITNYHTLTGAVSSRDIQESNRAMAEQTMEQVRLNVGNWIREEQRNGTA